MYVDKSKMMKMCTQACKLLDPDILPRLQVDRGAIKFVLSGANIMCPGLTSKGARMDIDLPSGSVVAIMAEGKENALAVGLLKMSTADM
jgi:PUA domain protein